MDENVKHISLVCKSISVNPSQYTVLAGYGRGHFLGKAVIALDHLLYMHYLFSSTYDVRCSLSYLKGQCHKKSCSAEALV